MKYLVLFCCIVLLRSPLKPIQNFGSWLSNRHVLCRVGTVTSLKLVLMSVWCDICTHTFMSTYIIYLHLHVLFTYVDIYIYTYIYMYTCNVHVLHIHSLYNIHTFYIHIFVWDLAAVGLHFEGVFLLNVHCVVGANSSYTSA